MEIRSSSRLKWEWENSIPVSIGSIGGGLESRKEEEKEGKKKEEGEGRRMGDGAGRGGGRGGGEKREGGEQEGGAINRMIPRFT